MKTEQQCDHVVDFSVVESVLSSLGRFACGPGCVPSHGFGCCVQFGNFCGKLDREEPEK